MMISKAAVSAVIAFAFLSGCANGGGRGSTASPKSSTLTPKVSASLGELTLVAEAGRPGDPDLDKRSRLSEIKQLLPSPDGGLVVVSHKDDRIFSEVTSDGRVRGFLLKHGAQFPDGTVLAGAMTAILNSDGSALVVNDSGILASVTSAGVATELGNIPRSRKGNSPHLLKDQAGMPLLETGGSLYRVALRGGRASFSIVRIKNMPSSFKFSVFSSDGKSSFADNGIDRVIRLDASGNVLSTYRVLANGGISSVTPGLGNSVWVGMADGSIFHLRANGRAEKVSWGGTTCADTFNPNPRSGSIADADVLLAKANQLYISDQSCHRIVALGIPE